METSSPQHVLTFERSQDWDLIRKIVTHPLIYPHVSDDYSPDSERWEPVKNDAVWYVIVKEDGELLGLWTFIPHNAICWDVHTCLLPIAYGDRAKRAAKEMAEWLWANTNCQRLITQVPDYNRLALAFAKRAGMNIFGINPRSYMHDGKLHDLFLLGMSRPEGICR